MIPFIIRRLLWMVVLLLVISFLTFVIFYTLPAADPATLRAGRQPSPELLATIRHTLGLDRPWYIQYLKYLERLVFHFDFGYSFQNNISVKSQIFGRLPAPMALSVGSALVAISAPVYWLGLVSLYLFSKDLGKLPLFEGQGAYPTSGNIFNDPGQVIPALIMPW